MIQPTCQPGVETLPPQVKRKALLVEDEPLVAMLAEDSLREIGFEPLWVTTADEALQSLQDDPAPALAMIDVGLPDMRGDDLAKRIRRDHPDLGIVLATGHDVAALRSGLSGDRRTVVLGKPYRVTDLEQAARAVTGA